MDELEIIITSDGSHTLRNNLLNETYHSIHGAVQESMHVFIRNGLDYLQQMRNSRHVSILEVGFGTGLNALLTLQYAQQHSIRTRYQTLELFPLAPEMWSKLNYGDSDLQHFTAIHEAPWGSECQITTEFSLIKQKASLLEADLDYPCDLIYFDAFAPSVQPELWKYEPLQKVTDKLNPGGVFVTYSAKGQLKRDLKALGLAVETLPGPPGKLQMVRAIRKPID